MNLFDVNPTDSDCVAFTPTVHARSYLKSSLKKQQQRNTFKK